jgi:ribosomal protein S18 acetylase RimI-like enzyme
MALVIREASLYEIFPAHKAIPEFDSPTSVEDFQQKLEGKESILVIGAFWDEQPVGYLIGYRDEGDSFYVWLSGVVKEYRRRGVLKAMMDIVIEWARKQKFERVTIKTRNSRRAMLAYLISNGFLIKGVEPRYSAEETRIWLDLPLHGKQMP